MARRTSRTLTEVELEFMQILWAKGDCTPEDIQRELQKSGRTLTGGSIRKILLILLRKGYVTRKKVSKTHAYSAKVVQEQANKSIIRDILDRAFSGSTSLMIAALLDSRTITDEDMKKIENLIKERKKEAGK